MHRSSLYEQLGLPPDATPEEIRHAYRQLVLHLHPDTNVKRGETEMFIDIQHAYEQLSDPAKKAEYDSRLPIVKDIQNPLSINTFYSQSSLTDIGESQLIYSLMEMNIHPDTSLLLSLTPLNISLVVDCSTSMRGIRLDTVKQTAIELIRQLHPNDIFSLVKFNDFAELLVPAGNLSDIKSIEMKIQLLQAGGGTEIYKGMELGFSQIKLYRSDTRVNHIILITDGRTYGDEVNCLQLADQASAFGIGISALGIGNQWNDSFLDHITSKTGGICKYVSDIKDIRDSMLEEISRLGSSLTEQITYSYTTHADVELQSAFRLHPDPSPLVLGSPLIFGFMPRQGAMSVLLEFLVKKIGDTSGNLSISKGFLNYEIPRHPIKTKYVHRLSFSLPISNEIRHDAPPIVILNAINLLSLYGMQERARNEMAKGDLSAATRHLEILATHLLNKGEGELAQSVMQEVSYIKQNQAFSEDGEKRIKYGTRSLLLPANTDEELS